MFHAALSHSAVFKQRGDPASCETGHEILGDDILLDDDGKAAASDHNGDDSGIRSRHLVGEARVMRLDPRFGSGEGRIDGTVPAAAQTLTGLICEKPQ